MVVPSMVWRQLARRRGRRRSCRDLAVLHRRTGLLWLVTAILAAVLSSSPCVHAQSYVTAAPGPTTASAGTLSPILSPAYAGMGIEPINLFSFTGTTAPNGLTTNLLMNLANYTGVPPHLRIGGNSGDTMLYNSDPQYAGTIVYPNPNAANQSAAASNSFIIGNGYFAALNLLPQNTPITYGLNLAYNGTDYQAQILAQANASFVLLKNITVVGFEVGNEPDLYVQNGYRPSGWTVDNYGSEWADRVVSLYNTILQPRNIASDFFEPAATATTATNNGHAYRISSLVNTGVATGGGIYVAGWNQHDYYYYTGVSDYTLTLAELVNLATTESQFNEWKNQAAQAVVTGKPYYLREMGSVGPTGMQGITDVFANTLWTFNFFLYAATVQVSSVQMHMTSNSYASPWVPAPFDEQLPHVRTTYYAWAAMDQIIGKSCTTRIGTLTLSNVPSKYTNNVRAYTVYQGTNLRAVVVINSLLAYQGAQPGSVSVQLSMPSLAGQMLYVSSLQAGGADASSNTTWNGISYEVSGDGTPTVVDSSTHTLQVGTDGTVVVPVNDTQAVVVALNQKLGSETNVDTSACNDLASNPEGGENVGTGTAASRSTRSAAPTFGEESSSAGGSLPTFKSTQGFNAASMLRIPAYVALLLPCAALFGFFELIGTRLNF